MTDKPLADDGISPGLLVASTFGPEDRERVEAKGYLVVATDLTTTIDKAALLATVATDLNFSPSFGHNWDAFEEAFTDWADAQKATIWVIYGFTSITDSAPDTAKVFVEVIDQTLGSEAAVTCLLVTNGQERVTEVKPQ